MPKFLFPVILLFMLSCKTQTPELELWDGESGEMLCSFPLKTRSFSLSFFHSVNKSDVEEFYTVEGDEIILTSCLYSAFGAGVASEVSENQKLTVTSDGKMLIEGINTKIDPLLYAVSVVHDHFLHIDGTVHNLTQLGLKGHSVEFKVKK